MMVVEIFMYVYTQYGSITFTYLYMYVECSGGRKIVLPFREMRSFFGTKSSPREEMQNMAVVEALFIVRQNITGGCKSVEQCFDFFTEATGFSLYAVSWAGANTLQFCVPVEQIDT